MTGQTPAAPARPRQPVPRRSHPAGGARVVTAEPGGGRTTFLEHAARAFTAGPAVLVRADPARVPAVPLAGLRALLDTLSRTVGEPAAAALSRTVGGPPAAAPPRPGPLFRGHHPTGPGPAPAPVPTPTPAPGAVLLDALHEASARSPLLVCVDDAHRWDGASRAALGHAAARLCRTGRVGLLLSVAGYRPVAPEFAGLPVTRIEPLSPAEATALLDETTDRTVDLAVRDRLVDAAEGNPGLLLAMVRRLTPAELRGLRPLTRPLADAEALTGLFGDRPAGLPPVWRGALPLTVAAALRDGAPEDARIDLALALRAAGRLLADGRFPADRPPPGAGEPRRETLPEVLSLVDGRIGFHSDLLCRAVYAEAGPAGRRAAHRALAEAQAADHGGPALRTLLHRARSAAPPWPGAAAELAEAAADPTGAPSRSLRCAAYAQAAGLTGRGASRAERFTEAAEQALLGGRPHRALGLLDAARHSAGPAPSPALRGRIELLRGTTVLYDGPVDEAQASLLLAADLLSATLPAQAERAALAASDAAWTAGDVQGCLRALRHDAPPTTTATPCPAAATAPVAAVRPPGATPAQPSAPRSHEAAAAPDAMAADRGSAPDAAVDDPGTAPLSGAVATEPGAAPPPGDYRIGVLALLEGDHGRAGWALRRQVVEAEGSDEPERILRAAACALLLGDLGGARRAGARALAAARESGTVSAVARAREYLAYAELRAGRHAVARVHAEEGLRAAHRTGQRNAAAHHRALLALAASIEGDPEEVEAHATAALTTARRHGLAQAATLAEWAAARADLARGRPREAADRLGPLVGRGPGRGHFAVWMFAVPCFVEAAASVGRGEGAAAAVQDFARWAGLGADPQAPAQLLRCRALLAPADRADALYRSALAAHDMAGGDFERARTALLYGKWLRRRRRLREARDRLGSALMGFERCGARAWAEQARAELRANGVSPGGAPRTGGLSGLTPQQQRIARCVAEGATNREVALTLSVSTRTVDYHLRKVFAALGVRSRVELVRMVEQSGGLGRGER
ncbi:LuxR C-terminal-related transcriptional regulator [Streptomyces sp. NPDC001388]|uniref:LuxR C-terminal-related transcriptional regulator n=1 Tax=Streptomyces sp. NPDC001388 TaxID=3364568 RepID=UPI0036793438